MVERDRRKCSQADRTDLTIRHGQPRDRDDLVALLGQCTAALSRRGMHHWRGVYDDAAVSENLRAKQVYLLERDGELVGCVAIGRNRPDYYDDCWPHAPEASYYLGQLAVHPAHQKRGYGALLVRHCLQLTTPSSVQLDAVAHYPALQEFYVRLGFQRIASGFALGDYRYLYTNRASTD